MRAVLAVCGAFLVVQEVRVVGFGGGSLGPLSSRGAHDVVLLAAALACLARGVLVRAERPAWLPRGAGAAPRVAAARRRRARRDRRRDLLPGGPGGREQPADPLARGHRLPVLPA